MPSKKEREALEERAKLWEQYQEARSRAEKDGATDPDGGETRGKQLDEIERLSKVIEEEQRSARAEEAMNAIATRDGTNPRPGDGEEASPEEAYRSAFDRWARRGMAGLAYADQEVLSKGLRALGEGSGTAGGYTVPTTLLQKMIEAQKAFGGIAQHAETMITSDGQTLQWPTNDDTGNVGAILAENTAVTEQDFLFGSASLSAWMFTSKMVRASLQLLQDSAFDFESWLARKLGERIGRAQAGFFATGSGVNQPQGLVTGLTKGVTSASATTITYDNLVDLEHSIDAAYRSTGRTRYLLSDDALRVIRKLKDTQNRPLWVPAMAGGVPDSINGQPYTVDNGLATVGSGTKPVVFGDIGAAYVVRYVNGAQTMQLRERYAEFLQVGFLGFQRADGRVQDTSAAAVLTQAA